MFPKKIPDADRMRSEQRYKKREPEWRRQIDHSLKIDRKYTERKKKYEK